MHLRSTLYLVRITSHSATSMCTRLMYKAHYWQTIHCIRLHIDRAYGLIRTISFVALNAAPKMSYFLRVTLVWLVVLAYLQTSCTSIRPVVKIGLLAPFEGLYRRTGYTALAAMRTAIAETPMPGVDILPLALDDSRDPYRAAQKLLVDHSVQAIVGPQSPTALYRVLDLLPSAKPTWLMPLAVTVETKDFADPPNNATWAIRLIAVVAGKVQREHTQRLVLAGWTPGWPQLSDDAWTAQVGMPVHISADSNIVTTTDAVFWLGNPEDAAPYLHELRKNQPSVPFWLGPQGGDPVFVERAKISGPVYWAIWLGTDYAAWAAHHNPATPFAYLVYQATRQSILAIAGQPDASIVSSWKVQMFAIGIDGKSQRIPNE